MAGSGLFDKQWLMSEACGRWLSADEIWEMLLNPHLFEISKQPPCSPCSGSVYFFDRRVTRYFRNDGHKWKKRKNGKAMNEAHVKLKVGNIPMIHCYYAWGEENPNFQRRCYSLLAPDLMHVVFVHYLEVKEMTREKSDLALPVLPSKPESCSEICMSNGISEQKAQNAKATFSESWHVHTSQSVVHLQLGPLTSDSIFDAQMKGDLSYMSVETELTSNGNKVDAKSLLTSGSECQGEALSFEEPLQHLGLDVDALGFSGKENFDSGRLMASDIFPGCDGLGLHRAESLYLMSDENSDSFGQVSDACVWDAISDDPAFFLEDHCPFPYDELQYTELQDFQNLMEEFVLGIGARRAQRRRRWTKIYGVFSLFSVRKYLGFKGRQVPNIP